MLPREGLINDNANLNFPKAFPWKNTDMIICLLTFYFFVARLQNVTDTVGGLVKPKEGKKFYI